MHRNPLQQMMSELSVSAAPLALCSSWQSWFTQATQALEARIDPRTERRVASAQGGVAVVPVRGVILPRASIWEMFGLATSVQTLTAGMRALVADPQVKAIVLDVDSPGGVVSGVHELAAEIRGSRGTKPIVAQVNHLAASAAYWLASAADEIAAPASAKVGSIGVYTMHVDQSRALDQAGVTVTLIAEPAEKVEGNPFAPLSEAAAEHLQAIVAQELGQFRADVAAGRGIAKGGVKDEWARLFTARDGLAMGLVDRIRTLDETLTAYGVSQAPARGAARAETEQQAGARRRQVDLLTAELRQIGVCV